MKITRIYLLLILLLAIFDFIVRLLYLPLCTYSVIFILIVRLIIVSGVFICYAQVQNSIVLNPSIWKIIFILSLIIYLSITTVHLYINIDGIIRAKTKIYDAQVGMMVAFNKKYYTGIATRIIGILVLTPYFVLLFNNAFKRQKKQ